MSDPRSTGQQAVLETHYARTGSRPVAYVDETYHVETDGRSRFYVLAAVVVTHDDRDDLRDALDTSVPTGWWHTTDALRTAEGREAARALIRTLEAPANACVIVDKTSIDADDKDGSRARSLALSRLLIALQEPADSAYEPVGLVVMEEQRNQRLNNLDRAVRSSLISSTRIANSLQFAAVSPGVEHLLWLPDLACSAYRRRLIRNDDQLFAEIEDITRVIKL